MTDYIKWTKDQRNASHSELTPNPDEKATESEDSQVDDSSRNTSVTDDQDKDKVQGPEALAAHPGGKKEKRQRLAQQREKLKPLFNRIRQLEKEMEKLQGECDSINQILSNPQTFETHEPSQIAELNQKYAQTNKRLLEVETQWYAKSEELEAQTA